MEILSPDKTFDFQFLNYPADLPMMDTPFLQEEVQENEMPYGQSYMKQWCFDGIRILYTRTTYKDHFKFHNSNDTNLVGLEFNIKGRYKIHHAGNTYLINGNQHNIVYSPGVDNTFENGDLEAETFKIEFRPGLFRDITSESNDILKSFVDRMSHQQAVVLSPMSGIIDASLARSIDEVVNCKYSGGLKKTFLLSKCLEILVLQAESFARMNNPTYSYARRPDDIEKFEFVRKYMVEHMDMPPSLSELARLAGLNEYKLKRGFRELYNSTVFGFLADYRLNVAKQRLESNWQSIAEIAYDLGYSSPQHFSKAFKEKFGHAPKAFRRG